MRKKRKRIYKPLPVSTLRMLDHFNLVLRLTGFPMPEEKKVTNEKV